MTVVVVGDDTEIHGVHVKWLESLELPNEVIICQNEKHSQEVLHDIGTTGAIAEASLVTGTVEWRAAVE